MKKVLYLSGILFWAGCSAPKYTYYFDHYDYNSGKKATAQISQGIVESETEEVLVEPDQATLVASVDEEEIYVTEPAKIVSKQEAVTRIKSMTKEERKELKREIKQYVKDSKRESLLSGNSAKGLETDVRLAAIFGAVGIVLLIIGGDILTILGAVALLVGLYFFIRWLARQ